MIWVFLRNNPLMHGLLALTKQRASSSGCIFEQSLEIVKVGWFPLDCQVNTQQKAPFLEIVPRNHGHDLFSVGFP